ncbi:Rnase Y domain-containing protein, partial [Patescibacteria group bacterium]|nr:Rnase Y domain-containing protein [Patescibacteria group bacterium]
MITIILIAIIIASIAFSIYNIQTSKKREKSLKNKLNKMSLSNQDKEEAHIKAEEIILEAKNKALEIQKNAEEKELNAIKTVAENEKNIAIKEELLNRKTEEIKKTEENIQKASAETEKIRAELSQKLEKIASLTKDEAKKILLEQMDEELKDEKAKKIKENEEEVKLKSEDISKNILIETMQKTVSEYIGPATTAIVDLPNDDIKGKIIGKEGRNIRSFEKITGVDVIVDDVPGSITISCFDPLRREVAIMAMKMLIEDKRIHPGKIEEMVAKAKENLSKEIRKFGEKMVYDAGIRDVRPELISLLGRMKYRYSYGQSLATHTMEMVQIAENLAQTLDANVYLAKKCALFHDIGKVVTAEQEVILTQ